MSGRVYERKFDWDEARRLYSDGANMSEIGRRLGVSAAAVRRVVLPGVRETANARAAAWAQQPVPCVENCGRTCTRIAAKYHSGRCRECASIKLASSAKATELRCAVCSEWKPDDEFPHNRAEKYGRRGRHTSCRGCLTVARREHRKRNREHENAYQRAYRARRRADAKARSEGRATPQEGADQSAPAP